MNNNNNQHNIGKFFLDFLGSDTIRTINEEIEADKRDVIKKTLSGDLNVQGRNGQTALMYASKNGDIEMVKTLIKLRCDMNVKDDYGHTALMLATNTNQLDVIKLLFQNGADVNVQRDKQPNDGWTALMLAAAQNKLPIVSLLLSFGADPNIKNDDGYTAIYQLKYNEDAQENVWKKNSNPLIVELLEKVGAH